MSAPGRASVRAAWLGGTAAAPPGAETPGPCPGLRTVLGALGWLRQPDPQEEPHHSLHIAVINVTETDGVTIYQRSYKTNVILTSLHLSIYRLKAWKSLLCRQNHVLSRQY